MAPQDNWSEYEKLVMSDLRFLKDAVSKLHDRINNETVGLRSDVIAVTKDICQNVEKNTNDITALKVRMTLSAVVAGAIAGVGSAMVPILFWVISKSGA